MIELDLGQAVKEIKAKKAKIVAVQIPESLKAKAKEIASGIEKGTGSTVFTFVDPCFGACDIADQRAKVLGANLLVHFGHSQFVEKQAMGTVYIPLEYRPDENAVGLLAGRLAKKLGKRNLKRIALCTTIQHAKELGLLEKKLGEKGLAVFVGRGKNLEKGQVLGCNYSSVKAVEKKVEAVAFLGDGLFHALGLGFAVEKPVFVLNPIEKEVGELGQEKDLFLRKRIAMIEKAKQAKSIAIWVSTKRGQQRMENALALKKKFEEKGKKAFVLVSDLLDPGYIIGMGFDAIVSTACPRIALDDSSLFRQPIVNQAEALIALGKKSLKEYSFDELV